MGSPGSKEWLELSLGLRGTKKKQEEAKKEEDEMNLGEEGEGSSLSLRLQIGPKCFDTNMGIMGFMSTQNNQKWAFHSHSLTNFPHFHGLSSPPPPNPAGLWFSLRSSPNRKGGAPLPQIPKAYIRVKDEKMTVLMVKKYLLTKLGLSHQAEVELWCMGERLLQTQSLKQVRDGVWLPKLVEFVNSNSSLSTSTMFQTTYLMCLHYGTTCLF
ncbi:protein LAX PANICLE 2-like [Cucurbita moschata]|uniref:Protein LAX PANICLE 2-like n=1 Tax=Cucurbita moschata TaxID=3662 RepID=A0A6J1F0B3_CUCMO|nr:protein LAX PANICLE 2-like [Cucurbita moschata]